MVRSVEPECDRIPCAYEIRYRTQAGRYVRERGGSRWEQAIVGAIAREGRQERADRTGQTDSTDRPDKTG